MGDLFPLFGGLFAIFFHVGKFLLHFFTKWGPFCYISPGGGVFFVFMGAFYGLSRPHAKTFAGAHGGGGGGLTIEIRLEENRQINCQNKGKKIPNPKI